MVCSGIPGLTLDAVNYIHNNLWLDCSDSQATERFTRIIEESLASKFTRLNWFAHSIAQFRSSSANESDQLLSFVPQIHTLQTDGKIKQCRVITCMKRRDPDKVYVLSL